MALLDKFQRLVEQRQAYFEDGLEPARIFIERLDSPTRAIIEGRETILFGTNNYLGLTLDPDCIEAGRKALEECGTGTTGSRMANGSYSLHSALERELADFFSRQHALIFSTGYNANLGVISGLAGPEDVILIDADSHASIYDGCRLSGAEILRFRHDDFDDLDRRLRRLGPRAKDAMIVVEGLYSMLGDRPDLARVAELKERYGATLVVDEAHSLGVLGEHGRGRAEEADVESSVDVLVGTFSKSLGATGGYCVSDLPEIELLRYSSRPFVFTASPCPSVVASTSAALRALRERPAIRERLWKNVHRLHGAIAHRIGLAGREPSPVVPIVLPDAPSTVRAWKALLEMGIYANLVLPPASPNGISLLRLSVSSAHSEKEIDALVDALQSVLEGVLEGVLDAPEEGKSVASAKVAPWASGEPSV